jgi:hypothetical protein
MPTDDTDVAAVVRRELELLEPAIRADASAVRERLHPDFREIGASGRLWDASTMARTRRASTIPTETGP